MMRVQWSYDALTSHDSPSYYAQRMSSTMQGDQPRKVVPRTEKADGLSADFTSEFPACLCLGAEVEEPVV